VSRGRALLGPFVCVAVLFGLLTGQAMAYAKVVGLTTEVPSRIATFSIERSEQAQLHAVDFPSGATDTDLIGIDYRPRSDDLYALGEKGTVYVLQGSGPFTAVQLGPTPIVDPIGGSAFGFGFDPVGDQLRVVDDAGGNLRFGPFNGSQIGPDGTPLSYASGDPHAAIAPLPSAMGFSEAFPAAMATMYLIDASVGSLAVVDAVDSAAPGMDGVLHTVGNLSVGPITEVGGLDLPPRQDGFHANKAHAVIQRTGADHSEICALTLRSIFYSKFGPFDIGGQALNCRSIGGGQLIESVAIEPYSIVRFEGDGEEPTFEVSEGDRGRIVVGRIGAVHRPIEVSWETSPSASKDLGREEHIVTFEPGQSRALFGLSLPDDNVVERTKSIALTFGGTGSGNWVTGSPPRALVRVVDDDVGARLIRPRKKIAIRKILRQKRLSLRYWCTQVCRTDIRLYAAGRAIARVTRSNFSSQGDAVFFLKGRSLIFLRRHLGSNSLALTARGTFYGRYGQGREVLRFKLRR